MCNRSVIPALAPHRRRLALPLLAAGAVAGAVAYVADPRNEPVTRAPVIIEATPPAAIDHSHCLTFLDDYLRHPNLMLTLERGVTDAFQDVGYEWLAIEASGDAMWTAGGMPARRVYVSPAQLAAISAAATSSCDPDDPWGDLSHYVDVHWGSPLAAAQRVGESPARAHLESVIEDVLNTYRNTRLAERPDVQATLTLKPYAVFGVRDPMTVTFEARGTLTIVIRGRTLTVDRLDVAARVDMIDWLELGGPTRWQVPAVLVDATLRALLDAGMLQY